MSLTILIVDDSDVTRTMIERTLGMSDLPIGSIGHAADGHQALAYLRSTTPDVVLADLNMPNMDGTQLLGHMRADPQLAAIPVIVVSAEDAAHRAGLLASLGAASLIRKPFTPERIHHEVTRVTSQDRRRIHRGVALPSDEDIDQILVETLECFAFAFVTPAPTHSAADPGPMVTVSVGFSGHAAGRLVLSAPRAWCTALACDATGMDAPGLKASAGVDALGEVANIVAGRLVTLIGAGQPSTLHPPRIDTTACGSTADRRIRHFALDEGDLVAVLELWSPVSSVEPA